MTRLQKNLKRRLAVAIAGMVFVGTTAIALAIRHSDPTPLSDDETLSIKNAIHAIATGNISNMKQNRDGSVTAFVASGSHHKQTVVAAKVGETWTVSVARVYF